MTKTHYSIKQGLSAAQAHARGDDVDAVVHDIDVPDPDMAAIRARSWLSQQAFARSIGVTVGTLRGWKQGRRRPKDRRAFSSPRSKNAPRSFRTNYSRSG